MKISYLLILASLSMLVSSTIYSVSSDFEVSYEVSPKELAHASFEEKVYEKGWNYLHIYANSMVGLLDQHRGAGFLEGYLEYKGIYAAYQNLCEGFLKGEQLKSQAQDFIDRQMDYLQQMVVKNPHDIFWQYAGAYLQQLRFMYRGYLTRINLESSQSMYIGFSNFYYLTNFGDLEDLIPAFHDRSKMESMINDNDKEGGNCNGYVKLLNGELLIGHSTHNIFQFLLRTYKTYSFPSRDERVGAQWFSFSSRPGDLISKDDFYVVSSGLVVMETSFSNMNPDNYNDLSPQTVPCWLRQTIAMNLARNGQEWVDYFLRERSGTHNNQWMVIDKNQLAASKFKNIVVFVEEGFSKFQVVDMTERLQQKGYLASYNVPFTKTIYHKLAYEKYPYTYEEDPRAYEYAKYNKIIENAEDMKKWLLMNENQDPTVGIAPRYDLKQKGKSTFGLTDLKIVTPETMKDGFIWAYSGPSMSSGRFPAFNWNDWPNQPSYGMPKQWNFTFEKFRMMEQQVSTQKEQQIVVSEM